MTSEPLEVRVTAVFDYWDAYIGGEKINTDGLKRHTRTDVITHKWPTLDETTTSSFMNKKGLSDLRYFSYVYVNLWFLSCQDLPKLWRDKDFKSINVPALWNLSMSLSI